MNGKRRLIGSFNHGSMANAMLQAIGAQAPHPGRQVISMSGDGGFTLMMGDSITLRQHDLPIKVVVLNNGPLGFVELEMRRPAFWIPQWILRIRTLRTWRRPWASWAFA